jgi:hypothetical protein
MAEENPLLKETTFGTTSTVGQSGPVVDPFAEQNAELAALKQRSAEMAAKLGLGGSTSSGQKVTPQVSPSQAQVRPSQVLNMNSYMSKYPVLPTHSQMYRADVAGHPYDFKNTTYRLPVVTRANLEAWKLNRTNKPPWG